MIFMPLFVGLDVSKYATSICIIDEKGRRVREGVAGSEPGAIAEFLRGDRRRYKRIGLEAGSLATWLYEGLARAGLPAICVETRNAHKVISARKLNKTDKNDARGLAELMRSGQYKAVHVKTAESQAHKAVLVGRKCLVAKRRDIDNALAGLLLQAGVKGRPGHAQGYSTKVSAFAAGLPAIRRVLDALVAARNALIEQIKGLEREVERLAREDEVCRRLCTAPGVGPLTALAYRSAIDLPERFARSRDVAVHLGLTPATRQSGRRERRGRISKCGDAGARTALYLAAFNVIRAGAKSNHLRTWGLALIERRGRYKATVALARRLAVILHRMWVTGTDFCDGRLAA
jgi:transposase